jgi:hypothetical protein
MRRSLFALVMVFFVLGFPALTLSDDAPDASSAPAAVSDVTGDVVESGGGEKPAADKAEATPATDVEKPVEEKSAADTAEEAPKQPESEAEAKETVGLLTSAFQSGTWPVVAGLVILLLVWVGNRFGLKERVGAKWVPWIAAGVGVLSTVGIALAAGAVVWWQALLQGLVAGVVATGLWELVFKRLKRREA